MLYTGRVGWEETAARCLVENEKRVGYPHKEHGNTYSRMVETVTKQLARNVREFVKH